MAKKNKEDYKDGTIKVTVPFVKDRDLDKGIHYHATGKRTFTVPVDVYLDKISGILADCKYTDYVESESYSRSASGVKLENEDKKAGMKYLEDMEDRLIDLFEYLLS